MLVVNPDGTLYRYALDGDEMVALEPVHNPEYVAPAVSNGSSPLSRMLRIKAPTAASWWTISAGENGSRPILPTVHIPRLNSRSDISV